MTAATARPPADRQLPSAVRIAGARSALELRLFFRDRQLVIFSFLYPVVMLVIFGSVFQHDRVAGDVTYTQYFLAGIVATGIMLSTFQALGVQIALERESGELARLQALATPAMAYFGGKAAQVVTTIGLQLVGLLLVARYGFGVPLPVDSAHWLTFAWVGVSGALAGTVLGIAASMLPRRASSAATVIAPIALVLEFFSGVFFVYGELPTWMRDVAAVFPLRWVTLGMRSAFLPEPAAGAETGGGWHHETTLLVLAVWVVGGLVICVRRFRWRRSA